MGGDSEVNPDNPLCPVCGAADWYSDPRVEFGLWVLKGGNAFRDEKNDPMVVPLNAFTCRSCRFVRLQSARGDLETRWTV